jgi:hypothetical protein
MDGEKLGKEAAMKKVQFVAVFWTMLLAIPFTVLALSLAAYTTEHLSQILNGLQTVSQATTVGARGWIAELYERWPEVAGMIVGQLVIMITLLLVRRSEMAKNESNS